MDRIDFAQQLRARRLERGLEQTHVARAMGVTQAAVGQWERGRCLPRPATLELLEKFGLIEKEDADA